MAAAGNDGERKVRTEGLWQKCDGCRQIIWKKDLEANWNVCPKCGHHFRIDAAARLKLLLRRRVSRRSTTDLRFRRIRWASWIPSLTASA